MITEPPVFVVTKRHELKTDPVPFEQIRLGTKTFDMRYNDREFKTGDTLWLRETKHSVADEGDTFIYTGNELFRKVIGITTDYGLKPGWVCMSLGPVESTK